MDMDVFQDVFEASDAYVVRGTGHDPTFRWLTQFHVPDPSYVIVTPDEIRLLTRGLEVRRATREARVDVAERLSEYSVPDDAEGVYADAHRLEAALDALDIHDVSVPPTFPVAVADRFRSASHDVSTATPVDDARVVKRSFELDALRRAQRDTEEAMRAVRELLQETSARGGQLYHDGEPLTTDEVRRVIRNTLPPTTIDEPSIVASGTDGADPHERGDGVIPADEPIVVDIFPRFESGYHGDMTRTFVCGEPDETVSEMHDAVVEALDAAKAETTAGSTGDAVHSAAASVIDEHGFEGTPEPDSDVGFIHSAGHGVGLALHEQPSVSAGAGALPDDSVVTLEPGLYDPSIGGVRVEDMVIVTDDGYECLNDMSYDMVLDD